MWLQGLHRSWEQSVEKTVPFTQSSPQSQMGTFWAEPDRTLPRTLAWETQAIPRESVASKRQGQVFVQLGCYGIPRSVLPWVVIYLETLREEAGAEQELSRPLEIPFFLLPILSFLFIFPKEIQKSPAITT